jgi:DnaK suppressor protein
MCYTPAGLAYMRSEEGSPNMCCTPYRATDRRTALEAKRAELEARIRDREPIEAIREPDPLDDGLSLSARDQASVAISHNTRMLRRVCDALDRMDAGTWGVCAHCDEQIGEKRLAAVPWAECCRECQEIADAERRAA